jgi:O-methyltransferase
MASGSTSKVHAVAPGKIQFAKTGLEVLRNTLTFFAKISLPGVDGQNYSAVIPEALYTPWKTDQAFQAAYKQIRDHTTVDVYRCYELWHLLGQAARAPGEILEVGVWRGGTGCLLAARASQVAGEAKVYLCDTFQGVVKAGGEDNLYKGGEHADTSAEIVTALAQSMGLHNVEILAGIFPDQTGHVVEDKRFRFCHIDVDVYQSAKDVVEWVWPRMPIGGVLVFDDYGFPHVRGVRKLVDELAERTGFFTIQNLNGHAVIVKTSAS